MLRRARAAALAAALSSCGLSLGAMASEAVGDAEPASAVAARSEPVLRRPEPRPAIVPSLHAKRLDEAWLASLPAAEGDATWRCLTEALYFEARGEDAKGQFAVAEVILNRVDSGRFPDNVCAVINQGTGRQWECQFTYTCDGRPETVRDRRTWALMGKIARLALNGAPRDLTHGALFYHTRAVSPSWSRAFFRTTTIGAHHFYSPETQLASN